MAFAKSFIFLAKASLEPASNSANASAQSLPDSSKSPNNKCSRVIFSPSLKPMELPSAKGGFFPTVSIFYHHF